MVGPFKTSLFPRLLHFYIHIHSLLPTSFYLTPDASGISRISLRCHRASSIVAFSLSTLIGTLSLLHLFTLSTYHLSFLRGSRHTLCIIIYLVSWDLPSWFASLHTRPARIKFQISQYKFSKSTLCNAPIKIQGKHLFNDVLLGTFYNRRIIN